VRWELKKKAGKVGVIGMKYDQGNGNKKEKVTSHIDETDCEQSMTIVSKQQDEEYEVIMKLSQEGASFGKWNLIQITKSINKLIGEIKNAKVVRNGALLIFCRNKMQQEKALELNRINGKKIKCVSTGNKALVRGVITGIPVNVTEEQIKDNVTG